MNKKLIALLLAGLLVASFTACNDNQGSTDDTSADNADTTDNYIVIGTDEEGNDITEAITNEPVDDPGFDPTETDPVFTDVTKKVVVFASVATVRTSTVLADNNAVGWPSEGRILDVTGESENWYRITYAVDGEEKECYIAKTVAADADVLDAFTSVEEEEVEIIVEAVNVRSYPSSASSNSIRGSLKKGTKVTRVAVSENWSRIIYEVVSETETDAEGKPVVEIKQYYVSNDCIQAPEAATTEAPAEETTEAPAN